ncbi:FAD-binding domain-containing protein [Rhodopila sp.]|uniref:FAD-binding domain-containing protein n=1 Tax=Rhodopila sp. TaxID=2480087 RepID=UPI003D13EC89
MVQVVWFKRDLRTTDHRPLAEAAAAGPVLPLYVAEPDYWALPDTSRRQWRAIQEALAALAQRLDDLGAPLIVRTGTVVDCLARIHRAIGITRLLSHEETGNGWTYARDQAVRRFCRSTGIPFVEYPQFGVIRRLRNRDDWGRLHGDFLNAPIFAEPARLVPATTAPPNRIPTADDLGLAPDGCEQPQSGARQPAWHLLESFLAGRGATYRRAMSSPLGGAHACSRLSVPLATGAISIREVLARINAERRALDERPPEVRAIPLTAIDSLVSRLHWHCHFIQKLESEPDLEFRSLHPAHEKARAATANDNAVLQAWATGRTGFPFIDACMRSLIATGWLNFRMRAMVQAFASHQLGLDWQVSGTCLARLFTDYEPGIHWPQVQMQAAQTGINTPRMYSPVKQGADQDPGGIFTRRWVPELARLPPAHLQTPWTMDAGMQDAAGCAIGRDYPPPIVDPVVAIRLARERLSHIRQQPGYREAAEAVYARHGSRKRRIDEDDPPKRQAIRAERKARAARQLGLDL